jgi:glycosyltransferase involved in cell wall biosynthesis
MKVSIITVCYNAEATLRDTIESVQKQDYDNIEYILVDGMSNDSSLEIAKGYHNVFSKIISEPDQGIYDAMNKGIKVATGEIIGFLNADDTYPESGVISKVVSTLRVCQADACYGDLHYIDPKKNRIHRIWKAGKYNEGAFKLGWMPPHPTFFIKKEYYDSYGGFRTDLKISADYELMLRFVHKHKASLVYIPEVMVEMKVGGESNVSLKNRLLANREDRLAWKMNGLKPLVFTPYLKPLRKIRQFVGI